MFPKKTYAVLTALFCLATLFLTACSSTPSTSNTTSSALNVQPTAVRGGKLSYRVTAPIKSLNYMMAEDEQTIIAALFMLTSRLVEFDHESQKFVPGLAETWATDPDGTTVNIKLREGLKFSDGHPLTTDDIIFTLEAIYDERTQSPAFRDVMMIDDKQIATKKINEREMQMILPKPVPAVESYLVNLGVLPAHSLAPVQKAGKFSEAWSMTADPTSIITSGPFVVEAAVPGERIDLARNNNYYKKDDKGVQLPYLDKLSIEVIPDANNTFVRLTQGTLDIADRIRPGDHTELTKAEGPTTPYDSGPGLGIDYMWFNLNRADGSGKLLTDLPRYAWFSDKRFRHAIAAAVDRESIAAVTLQGLASPLYGLVSPANKLWIDPTLPKLDYSLQKAEQLLIEAGFRKTGDGAEMVLTDAKGNPVEFTLVVPAENEPRKLMAAVIQQDLAKLGIKMQIAPIENPRVAEKWGSTLDYDAILFGLSQTDTEPSSYQNFLLSSAATHQWQPKQKSAVTEWEARIDELFAEQAGERDAAKRFAQFAEIQKILREEMPIIPIAARHVVSAANSRIGNYSPSSIMPYSLWNVEELFIKQ